MCSMVYLENQAATFKKKTGLEWNIRPAIWTFYNDSDRVEERSVEN